LLEYWNRLQYNLDDRMIAGLRAYYARAAELEEVPGVPELRFAGAPAG
jgi:hypothetical protein